MKQTLSTKQIANIHRLMNEAAACYNRDDIAGAEGRTREVLAVYVDFPQALHLLGLCQLRQGLWDSAEDALTHAASLNTKDAQVFHDLGYVYMSQARWVLAIRAYLQAIDLRPGYAESYLNLGAAYESLGEYSDAERAFRRALELNPKSATAAGSLAALCESGNRLDEAVQFVERALHEDADDHVSNLTRAQLDFRAGRYHEAQQRLEALLQRSLTPRNRSLVLARLGAVYEVFAEYDRAFDAFRSSKEAVNIGTEGPISPGFYTLDAVQRVLKYQPLLMSQTNAVGGVHSQTPVFLVGFPRSGTTLLDQILSSHSRLSVLEEKENLRDLLQDFVTTDSGLAQLAQLGPSNFEEYQKKYWDRVAENSLQTSPDQIFIDKLPLNTIFMPLIVRLFPQTRFIFAVRDPRDVVLSCFTRAFGLNEAMRNFLTLDGTARYYSVVMQIGIDAIRRLGKAAYVIRYEMLIDDVENEAHRLCEFLGVDWEDSMLSFQETARKRRINTPSYHQVIQPIYHSAQQRWRNYAQHLQPVLPLLQPFVEYFRYS